MQVKSEDVTDELRGFMPSVPTGLELTFYSGVYGTCIGAMTQFGKDAKSLIGLSGIFIGLGEILGESSVLWLVFTLIYDAVCHVKTLQREWGSKQGGRSRGSKWFSCGFFIYFFITLSVLCLGQEGECLGCWTSATGLGGTQWCCWASSRTLLLFTWFSSTLPAMLLWLRRKEQICRPTSAPGTRSTARLSDLKKRDLYHATNLTFIEKVI